LLELERFNEKKLTQMVWQGCMPLSEAPAAASAAGYRDAEKGSVN
jgi:hypothetical protein